MAFKVFTNSTAWLGVMFIFQLPAIIFFLAIVRFLLIIDIITCSLFIICCYNARKVLALKELKGSAAAGGDVAHLVTEAELC